MMKCKFFGFGGALELRVIRHRNGGYGGDYASKKGTPTVAKFLNLGRPSAVNRKKDSGNQVAFNQWLAGLLQTGFYYLDDK